MKSNAILVVAIVLIIILALLLGLCIGYILGSNKTGNTDHSTAATTSNAPTETTQTAVGSYKNDNWNGKSAALVIKSDGTCLYPTRDTGTWKQEGDTIVITLDGSGSTHEAEIVPGGIVLHEHFFESTSNGSP